MTATTTEIADYLREYVAAYREEYERLVVDPPDGGGYPRLDISPYLSSRELECYVAEDGIAVADRSREPEYEWFLAGGPALMVDTPESQVPDEIVDHLKERGIFGESIGIYRIVADDGFPETVWKGRLGDPVEDVRREIDPDTKLRVRSYSLNLESLVRRLTYGAYEHVLDVHLPEPASSFWVPHITRDMGFLTADRRGRRFFHYLEISPHRADAAWDTRTIEHRVSVDVRRDFAHRFAKPQEDGGATLSFEAKLKPSGFHDRLAGLVRAIRGLGRLLRTRPRAAEEKLHEYLLTHPILLDVYGEVESKPRFYYPEDESPLDKEYVEPDFLIRYPGKRYKLVEIERPSKRLATRSGESRSEVSQAAFQIAEWRTFIQNHYDRLKKDYPGLSTTCETLIVISRSSAEAVGEGRDVDDYIDLIENQYQVDQVLTYDGLLRRAEAAYWRLSSMALPG